MKILIVLQNYLCVCVHVQHNSRIGTHVRGSTKGKRQKNRCKNNFGINFFQIVLK